MPKKRASRGISAIMLRLDRDAHLVTTTHFATFHLDKDRAYTAVLDSFPFRSVTPWGRLRDHYLDAYANQVRRCWLLHDDDNDYVWLEMSIGLGPEGFGMPGEWTLWAEL